MAGQGPVPKNTRRRANEPERGDWRATPGIGWQHGDIPSPVVGRKRLRPAALEAWQTWFRSWFASHWTPDDLPVLRQIVVLFNKVDGGRVSASERSELRQLMDGYGITKKGQQDRRWIPPALEEKPAPATEPGGRYGHLRAV